MVVFLKAMFDKSIVEYTLVYIQSVPALAEIMNLWNVLHHVVIQQNLDSFRWRLASNGKFSAKTAYAALFASREFFPGMVELWSSWAPLEVKIFVWLALHNRLWTVNRLAKRNMQHPPQCVMCC